MSKADLDSMFGIDIVTFGETGMRVRRVLSRKQQRSVSDAVTTVSRSSVELNKLLAPPEDGTEPMTDEELEAAAQKLEDQIHEDVTRGITAMVVNADELFLPEWSTPGLSQLFSTLYVHSQTSVSNQVAKHFPQSGSTE